MGANTVIFSKVDPNIEKKDEPTKKIGLFQLFRYADSFDILYIIIGSLFAIGNGSTLPLMTIFFGDIIQAIVTYPSTTNATQLDEAVRLGVLKMSLVGIATFVCSFVQMYCFMVSGERQSRRIREKYFQSVASQDVAWYDKHATGDLTNRLTSDMTIIQEGLSDKVGLLIQFTSAFLAGFVIGYIKGPLLALVLTSCLPFLSGAAYLLSQALSTGSEKSQKAYAGAADVAQQVLSSIRTVFAFGGEEKVKKRYAEQLDIAEKLGLRNQLFNGSGLGSIQFFVFNTYGLAFWFGNFLIPDKMNTGQVLNVIFAIIIGAFSLGNASPHIASVGNALGAAKIVFETIERKSSIDPLSEKGEKPTEVKGSIKFTNIDFHYPTRTDISILSDFNLEIQPGTTVALVGQSGSGKSTIVKLLERFYDPTGGLVSLDGRDIKQLNVSWLRQQIGMVSQEPVLFDTTIKRNIMLGLVDFDSIPSAKIDELIKNACKQANCWDFIQELPLKLDTLVGESGGMLSGGQKQRIAIARAIIKNPQILLLDEATSALDTESERIVQAALELASKNRTTIVIAHRLSTIKNADNIIVMEHGKIVEHGNHKQLIDRGGVYANLVTIQTLKSNEDDKGESETFNQEKIEKKVSESGKNIGSMEAIVKKVEEGQMKLDYNRLLAWSIPEWPILLVAGLGALFNGATQPCFAVLFTTMLTALGTDKANMYALLFVALSVLAFLSNFAQGLFKYAGEKAIRRIRFASFEAILRQEIGWFDEEENSTGALMSRLSDDASLVPGLTGQTFGAAVQAIGGVGAGLIIACIACWQLALVILGMVPLIGFAGFIQFKALVGFGGKTKKAYEKVSQTSNETISSIRTIITITQERYFIKTFNDAILGPHQITMVGAPISSATFGFSQCILHFTWAASLFYGSQLLKWSELGYTSDNILRAMFSIIFTAMAIGQVANFAPDAAKAKVAAFHIFALLDRKSKIDLEKTLLGDSKESVEGFAKFEEVNFAYPTRSETLILKGLTLEAKPGMTIALVGKSGCGKSTVMGLLERWYDPISGIVSLDSIPVKDWNLRKLRSFLAIVGQEPVLFNISIKDNIAYGAMEENPDDLSIYEAAKLANIHNFIMTLPDKYDTLVGEKGGKMSGGQKQRIAIARSLIRNPRLLLLDEATSALDSESEFAVQEALDAASKGRTTIVIAHRLSTIQNADLILVVNDGVIAEIGTHFELVDKKGIYTELVKQQQLNTSS